MKALYRKYRSRSLEELVGQEHITTVLANSLKAGKVSHAYLFVGPRGTGKTSVARILAHEVNGFQYELEDSYLDILEIDAASNTGVDNIRDLREKAMTAPATGKYKVYIIDEVHMLSKSAFNALLKTLEEPPEHVIFIMATTDAHKVPVTIVSRAQKFVFRLADEATMRAHLREIADKEGIKIDDGALGVIARRSGGSFRDALSLLDQISIMSEGEITAGVLEDALGLPAEEKVALLLEYFIGADTEKLVQVLGELSAMGVRPELVAEELIGRIVKDPRREYMGLLDKLVGVGSGGFPEVKLMLALMGGEGASASLSSGAGTRVRPSSRGAGAALGLEIGASSPSSTHPREQDTEALPNMHAPVAGGGQDATKEMPREAALTPSSVSAKETPVENETVDAVSGAAESNDVATSDAKGGFDWGKVVEAVRRESAPLGAHLSKLLGEMEGEKLVIYAKTKFIKNIVEKGMGLIAAQLPEGVAIEVLPEVKPGWDSFRVIASATTSGAEVKAPVEDEKIASISAILGDVEEVSI